jgi:hypothetical protein
MEFRRRENGRIGYEEHPRAGTSDDVEGLHCSPSSLLGQHIYNETDEVLVAQSSQIP